LLSPVDEAPRDFVGVSQIDGVNLNDQRAIGFLVRERPPASVRRGQPTLQRVGGKQIAAGADGTRADAVVVNAARPSNSSDNENAGAECDGGSNQG
jgi:hypothetical protein